MKPYTQNFPYSIRLTRAKWYRLKPSVFVKYLPIWLPRRCMFEVIQLIPNPYVVSCAATCPAIPSTSSKPIIRERRFRIAVSL